MKKRLNLNHNPLQFFQTKQNIYNSSLPRLGVNADAESFLKVNRYEVYR